MKSQPLSNDNNVLNFVTTEVFEKNYNAFLSDKLIIVNQGGSRSSKTYSLIQLLVYIAYISYTNKEKKIFSIVRKTMPSLKATVMRDFFEIIESAGFYDIKKHDRTNFTYELFGCLFEFFSVSDYERIKGRKRDYLWINEATEVSYDEYWQLQMRTTTKTFIDFNPSDTYSYIFEKFENDKDAVFIYSTILDNPFVETKIKNDILKLRKDNYELWQVYGLGLKAQLSNIIYKNWTVGDYDYSYDDVFYGLDFGFNHPTVLSETYIKDDVVHTREVIYQSKLTNNELIDLMKLNVKKNKIIFADAAEPARIEEIRKAGFNIQSADKSVKDGIDYCKRNPVIVDKTSNNAIKEFKSYSYKEVNGIIVDEPVKFLDDFLDSFRYGLYNYAKKYLNKSKIKIYKW